MGETNELLRNIYMTKYCRINAYKRTKEWDTFLQATLFIYNILLLSASILALALKNEIYNYLIALFSVATFSTGLFVGIKNYGAQSAEFKRCYNELEKLESELRNDESKQDEIEKIFNELITFSTNHDEIDNYRLKAEYFEDPIVASNDEKNGKDKKYWTKMYKRALAKNILIKSLMSFLLYPIIWGIALIVSLVIRPFAKVKHEKK